MRPAHRRDENAHTVRFVKQGYVGPRLQTFGGDRGPRFVEVGLASGGPRFVTQDFVDHDF